MKLPEKEFYSITEVAREWGCTEKDILQYAESRKVELALALHDEFIAAQRSSFGGDPSTVTIKGYQPLDHLEVRYIVHSKEYPRFIIPEVKAPSYSKHQKYNLTYTVNIASPRVNREWNEFINCLFIPADRPLYRTIANIYMRAEEKAKFESEAGSNYNQQEIRIIEKPSGEQNIDLINNALEHFKLIIEQNHNDQPKATVYKRMLRWTITGYWGVGGPSSHMNVVDELLLMYRNGHFGPPNDLDLSRHTLKTKIRPIADYFGKKNKGAPRKKKG